MTQVRGKREPVRFRRTPGLAVVVKEWASISRLAVWPRKSAGRCWLVWRRWRESFLQQRFRSAFCSAREGGRVSEWILLSPLLRRREM
ncbi:hypothetical protein SRHO_G00215070 [Serrasalmus rhombeus]